MAWYEVKRGNSGPEIPDGNNIEYPISQAPSGDKAYLEYSVQEIANAIQATAGTSDTYKIAEMANAIRGLNTGLHATNMLIYSADYTSGPLEAT